jgi:hypothetical protein
MTSSHNDLEQLLLNAGRLAASKDQVNGEARIREGWPHLKPEHTKQA